MKKYINLMLLLSISGIALSGILVYQHFYPELDMGLLSCGKGFSNPCIAVGQSSFSTIFGIPMASYGIFYYMILTFIILISDYAREKYYCILAGIIFIFVAAGLAVDLLLAVIMMYIGVFCKLCAATYLVNIVLMAVTVFYIKHFPERETIRGAVKNFFRPENPDQKAALSLAILFTFFLAFSIFAGTNIIRLKTGHARSSDTQISRLMTNFYNQKQEQVKFPESDMTVGKNNVKLKIHIFNDFLCSACYKLYQIEKYIMAKYSGRVQLIYYHYPLDRDCNRHIEDSIYPSSCLASQSMYAAAEAGFFEEYFFTHFSAYANYKDSFEMKNIDDNLEQTVKKFHVNDAAVKKFKELIKQGSGRDFITKHIESAERVKIEATPTIFISGRRIVGVPPKELLESIIKTELSGRGN